MNKERFLKKLGNRIVELREMKGFSQTQLAHACGKDPQSIERVENGKINPSAYYLLEIAKALDIPLKDILDF
ncbi:MAG: helix-turn-helix transcriptional regulator [Bacteroidetes bacterium]|nr:helix-turn-helix transcriptional regulator [Bacteroidota bacterium]